MSITFNNIKLRKALDLLLITFTPYVTRNYLENIIHRNEINIKKNHVLNFIVYIYVQLYKQEQTFVYGGLLNVSEVAGLKEKLWKKDKKKREKGRETENKETHIHRKSVKERRKDRKRHR